MPKFKKGQSGNPRGRPPKSRTLSNILSARAEDLVPTPDGTDLRTQQEIVADLLWQFATTGEVKLASGTLQADNIKDWVNAVSWLYTHIDGPATTRVDDDHITITIERQPALERADTIEDETDS
ncbi:MAG: DUF5681 domain-containing protein [Chloroflexota bacterium]